MIEKIELIYLTDNGEMKFNRAEKTGETELYILWDCYEDKKRKPTATFLQPKWLDTNKVLHLTSEETNVMFYWRILHLEKSDEGIRFLKDRYNNYINKYK